MISLATKPTYAPAVRCSSAAFLSPEKCPFQATRDGITFKVADTLEERLEALALVYECYTEAELMLPNEHGVRVLPQHLFTSTTILTASTPEYLICTATVIGENPLGLPLEQLYADEINERRQQGLRLAEVSCLASHQRTAPTKKTTSVLSQLIAFMGAHSLAMGIDRLVIAVHPRHCRYYQRRLGFEQFGEQRSYSKVCDRPAVGCELRQIQEVLDGLKQADPEMKLPAAYREPMPLSQMDETILRSKLLDASESLIAAKL